MNAKKHQLGGVRYWTYGDRTRPAVLMIHGFTGNHEGFQYIIPLLKDFYVVVPDVPGFGESELDFHPWTVHALAKRTNEFVQALEFEKPPFLVSHSLGGLVAASMLDQTPELYAQKTVFISPVATKISLFDARRLGAFFGGLQYYVGKKTGRVGERLVKNRRLSRVATNLMLTEKDPAKRATIYEHHYKNFDYISSIDYYHQLYRDINQRGAIDFAESLSKFTVLIVAGDKDNVTPLAGEKKLARSIKAKLSVIPGVGHLAHYEKPEAIATALNGFLK